MVSFARPYKRLRESWMMTNNLAISLAIVVATMDDCGESSDTMWDTCQPIRSIAGQSSFMTLKLGASGMLGSWYVNSAHSLFTQSYNEENREQSSSMQHTYSACISPKTSASMYLSQR